MSKATTFSRTRPEGRRASARGLRSFFAAILLTLALPLMAHAYTLVMSSGRHVEISDQFSVTSTALVYEASNGIRVTVWLKNIDVEATERANGEPAGSFAKRIAGAPSVVTAARPVAGQATGRREVSNQDLEAFRRKRLAEEAAYERERVARGLPSMGEMRARAQERDREFSEYARQVEASRLAEEYQRLSQEISLLRTQLNLINTQQSQLQTSAGYAHPLYYPYSLSSAYVLPWAGFNFRFGRHRALLPHSPFRRTFGPFHYTSPRRPPSGGRGPHGGRRR